MNVRGSGEGDRWSEKLTANLKERVPAEGKRGMVVGSLRMDLSGLNVLLPMMMAWVMSFQILILIGT